MIFNPAMWAVNPANPASHCQGKIILPSWTADIFAAILVLILAIIAIKFLLRCRQTDCLKPCTTQVTMATSSNGRTENHT